MQASSRAGILPGSGASVARQGIRNGIKEGRGRSILRPANERCAAIVFLAATGCPQQCRFRRRQGLFCSRHWRERADAS